MSHKAPKLSLRAFQEEIDNIHQRAKQRTQSLVSGDENILKKNKEEKGSKGKSKSLESPVHVVGAVEFDDNNIQSWLLSELDEDYQKARDAIAGRITQNQGEYIIRFSRHPARFQLFNIEERESLKGLETIPCSLEGIKHIEVGLLRAAEEIGAKVSTLLVAHDETPRASYLLRIPPTSLNLTPEVRCAVVGNVDAGKSTTLGVLTRGGLDDGRGLARVGLFRHKHEIESGRTSSVGMEILGFSTEGSPVLPRTHFSNDIDVIRREKLGWDEISNKSAKIVSFIDLAGHERYLKTTLYGLTSGAPSLVMLMVAGNAGLIGMSKEHLAIAIALNVPVVVCITKIDMTPANILAETVKQVEKVLMSPGCRKKPVFVRSAEIAIEISQVFASEKLCPIFQISNTTGEGLDFLRTFLNLLPSSEADDTKYPADQPLEYSVTEVWSVPYVGTVVDGILNAGQVKIGDSILIGPDSNGNFMPTAVKDIHRKRAPVKSAVAGQCVSMALKRIRRATVRKGMVIVGKNESSPPKAVFRFEGTVLILYHNTTVQRNYQAMLHCGAVRQTVRIINIDNPDGILRTGDRAVVQFEFISHPEFIKEGMKLLFREEKTKGLGVVTRLL